MAEVTWTQQALDDLEAICLYIARDAPGYATVFAERAFRAVAHLEQFPRSGRIVPEIRHDDIREVTARGSWIDSSVPSDAENTVRWIR